MPKKIKMKKIKKRNNFGGAAAGAAAAAPATATATATAPPTSFLIKMMLSILGICIVVLLFVAVGIGVYTILDPGTTPVSGVAGVLDPLLPLVAGVAGPTQPGSGETPTPPGSGETPIMCSSFKNNCDTNKRKMVNNPSNVPCENTGCTLETCCPACKSHFTKASSTDPVCRAVDCRDDGIGNPKDGFDLCHCMGLGNTANGGHDWCRDEDATNNDCESYSWNRADNKCQLDTDVSIPSRSDGNNFMCCRPH